MILDIEVAGQQLTLYPQRAVFWQQADCLMLSDLHLGKADTFQHHGIGVPDAVQRADVARLDQLLAHVCPKRCVVLGDFIHGRVYGAETVAQWRQLVSAHPQTAFEVVVGNHDRSLDPDIWQLAAVAPTLQIGSVLLSHEPVAASLLRQSGVALNVHGHIHPAWRAPDWPAKLPALIHDAEYLVLPAFSEFTAGVVQRIQHQRVWAFVSDDDAVVRVN
jgi:DNA ligase-associated metallophosphoesterase